MVNTAGSTLFGNVVPSPRCEPLPSDMATCTYFYNHVDVRQHPNGYFCLHENFRRFTLANSVVHVMISIHTSVETVRNQERKLSVIPSVFRLCVHLSLTTLNGLQIEVQGFPTLYFLPGKSKGEPIQYQGPRETEDMAKFIMSKVRGRVTTAISP